jgi:cytochrome P450
MMSSPSISSASVDLSTFDRFGREFQQDPYPWLDAMRDSASVFIDPSSGLGFVTRFDLVSAMLKDTATYSSAFGVTANEPPAPAVAAEIAEIKSQGWVRVPTMLTIDPPDHTRYRATVARSFNARVIAELRPDVERIVDEELDRVIGVGAFDANKLFSTPIPVRVIVRALNLDPGHEADIKRWSDATTAGIGGQLPPEVAVWSARETVELQRYLHANLVERQQHPRDDLLTRLVQSELPLADGDGTRAMTIEELMGIFQQLLGAGNETTTKLFTQLVRNLADHPEEFERLRADPSRAALIAEEALRLASPTQSMFRLLTRDVDVEGVHLSAGSKVVLSFSAANRDPAVFEDPHRFNPDRTNVRNHLAFGLGTHFCIGAPLSRLETVVSLERLAARCAAIRLAPGNDFEFEPSFMLRGLHQLLVEFDPA